jgi:hypothetical protein
VATSYFNDTPDMNTAMRSALRTRYGVTNDDFAPLLARYLAERADYDENMRNLLEWMARGAVEANVSTSGGPDST